MTDWTASGHPRGVSTGTAAARAELATSQEYVAGSESFAVIFHTHADFVWRVLRRLGVPEPEVEDALQEVFLVVARRLEHYEERGALRAWLFSIARQVAWHVRRANQRRDRKQQAIVQPRPPDDPQQTAERNQAVALVREFLAKLDENQAMVFYLCEVEGMTAPEVATALQVNLNTVYGRLRLARKRFEQMLAEQPQGRWYP
jgi:RNA polymerase sigma-70 factor, ECF subfamily